MQLLSKCVILGTFKLGLIDVLTVVNDIKICIFSYSLASLLRRLSYRGSNITLIWYGMAPEFHDIINEKPLKIHRKSTKNPLKSESLNT